MFNRLEVYENGTLVSVEDTREISDLQNYISNAINDYRDVVINGGIWYMGHFWDSDSSAQANLNGAATCVLAGSPLPSGFCWRDNNNINVPFTSTELITLGSYVVSFVNQVYNYSWELKSQVMAMTTLEELDSFVIFDQNWPDGNMDGTMPLILRPNMVTDAIVGQEYNFTFYGSGGKSPYTMTINSGTLPDGLSFGNSVISGIPTSSGIYTYEILLTDSTANVALTNSLTYTMNVVNMVNSVIDTTNNPWYVANPDTYLQPSSNSPFANNVLF